MVGSIGIATRREFLATGLGVVGIGCGLPQFLVRSALAGPNEPAGGSVLVVLQLGGGNDGLSSVVPLRNDDYRRLRRSTRIDERDALKVSDEAGLHPNLTGFRDLLDARSLAIVRSVGYPNPNLSHFHSMDIWHTADPKGRRAGAGWLGRAVDSLGGEEPNPALSVAIGSGAAPLAVEGERHRGLCFQQPEGFRFNGGRGERIRESAYRALQQNGGELAENDALQYVTRTSVAANASSERVRELASKHLGKSEYPATPLGKSLETVGALIAGGLETRIYYVVHGGFDTHAGQRGRHDRLMQQMSEAVVAFQRDLAAQGNADRVLTMAFSEFGRRAQENGGGGTDHGTAGPMFLIGPCVKPGLHGPAPNLADLDKGNLKFSIDFRQVYAAILERHLAMQARPVLGGDYAAFDCLA